MKVNGVGPSNAKIMLVGEAPGEREAETGLPFVGAAGHELTRMLADAKINRGECFITNVARVRPPNNDINAFFEGKERRPGPEIIEGRLMLEKEIVAIKPNVIVALGDTALWALTGKRGITKWRGSNLTTQLPEVRHPPTQIHVIPTYHPAAILRMWEWRWAAVQDLRKVRSASMAREVPIRQKHYLLRPSFEAAMDWLSTNAKDEIALDIETRGGQIACIGFASSPSEAISIPIRCVEKDGSYWSLDEEVEIVLALRHYLTNPKLRVIGQNLIYDCQYIARLWGFIPRVTFDTMLAQHCAFPGLPKSLDFIASLYCHPYVFWKDEGKTWDVSIPEEQYWSYNCDDACYTWEAAQALKSTIESLGLRDQFLFQMECFGAFLEIMIRGVLVSQETRRALDHESTAAMQARETWLADIIGYKINIRSPKQMMAFFYDECRIPPVMSRKTHKPTCDDNALTIIGEKNVILRPVVGAIQEARTLGVGLSNVIHAPIDPDGRMRCSYNIGGTETFRLSSSESAFGTGCNLQNITKGGVGGGGQKSKPFSHTPMPNLRRLLVPDPGHTLIDLDLERADLQVVVWEADDQELKAMLREGADIHTENAKVIFSTTHPTKEQRELAKRFCHGTNYGGSARTMAINCGLTIHQSTIGQQRWFGAHPGIGEWHKRTDSAIRSSRSVRNRFGYRRFYFERLDGILPEALAWVPQSTVAILINKILINIRKHLSYVVPLLQVHDSLTLEVPNFYYPHCLDPLRHYSMVVIPYDDPLIIPVGFKVSDRSWGDVEDITKEKV